MRWEREREGGGRREKKDPTLLKDRGIRCLVVSTEGGKLPWGPCWEPDPGFSSQFSGLRRRSWLGGKSPPVKWPRRWRIGWGIEIVTQNSQANISGLQLITYFNNWKCKFLIRLCTVICFKKVLLLLIVRWKMVLSGRGKGEGGRRGEDNWGRRALGWNSEERRTQKCY